MENEINLSCKGKAHHMERFMEVCLLLLLYQESGHGYTLAEKLAYFGFSKEELNIGSLYRTLRKMEKGACVTSYWEKGDQGPKKRVYQITQTGKRNLGHWVKVFKHRKKRISRLITSYEKIIADNN